MRISMDNVQPGDREQKYALLCDHIPVRRLQTVLILLCLGFTVCGCRSRTSPKDTTQSVDSCITANLLADLIDEYPIPISVSPNGSYLLLKSIKLIAGHYVYQLIARNL